MSIQDVKIYHDAAEQDSKESFPWARRIGYGVGVPAGIVFAFIYIAGIFTFDWPLAALIPIALISGIPSSIIEVWVGKDMVGKLSETIARSIVQNWRALRHPTHHLKPGQKKLPDTAPKNATHLRTIREAWSLKYLGQAFLNLMRNITVLASVLINGSGSAILGWGTLSGFLMLNFAIPGAALIGLPIAAAILIFSVSVGFNADTTRKRLVSLDPRPVIRQEYVRKFKDEHGKKQTQLLAQIIAADNAAAANAAAEPKKTSRKVIVGAIAFGLVAGVATASLTIIAIPALPFAPVVILGLVAAIGIPVVVTQVLSAYECCKQWAEGRSYQSTKAQVLNDYERLNQEKATAETEKKKLAWYKVWWLFFCTKHPSSTAKTIYGSKAAILLLKGLSTGVFTGLAVYGLLITLAMLGVGFPPASLLAVAIIAGVMAGAFDTLNTYFQNRYVLFKEQNDIHTLKYGHKIENDDGTFDMKEEPDSTIEVRTHVFYTDHKYRDAANHDEFRNKNWPEEQAAYVKSISPRCVV